MVSIVAKSLATSFKNISAARIITIQSRNCKLSSCVRGVTNCVLFLMFSVFLFLFFSFSLFFSFWRSGGWIRDWKPGPPPKTEAERIAAAKKYNLIPEDYETYDESYGTGDYPKLPIASQDSRDPYEDFDWHYHRRNFGETVRIYFDLWTNDLINSKWFHRIFAATHKLWHLYVR